MTVSIKAKSASAPGILNPIPPQGAPYRRLDSLSPESEIRNLEAERGAGQKRYLFLSCVCACVSCVWTGTRISALRFVHGMVDVCGPRRHMRSLHASYIYIADSWSSAHLRAPANGDPYTWWFTNRAVFTALIRPRCGSIFISCADCLLRL